MIKCFNRASLTPFLPKLGPHAAWDSAMHLAETVILNLRKIFHAEQEEERRRALSREMLRLEHKKAADEKEKQEKIKAADEQNEISDALDDEAEYEQDDGLIELEEFSGELFSANSVDFAPTP